MSAIRLSFLLLALGVIIGAFGAHAIKPYIEVASYQNFQTAVLYHFLHALGLLGVGILGERDYFRPQFLIWTVRMLLFGILFFSGSLYLLTTRDITGLNAAFLGPVTPLGGLCFVAAWVLAALGKQK